MGQTYLIERRNSIVRKKKKDSFDSVLSEKDYKYLSAETGLSHQEISRILLRFNKNNQKSQLNKQEFINLYQTLRPEPNEALAKISESIFRAFDLNGDGFISFKEFIIGYALTSRGDLKSKLEYAFALYDEDGNGYLEPHEVQSVLSGMIHLLDGNTDESRLETLTQDCFKELDANSDGKITKQEFVDGLQRNYCLRSLMSPFN